MANGQVVLVTTEGLSGGLPMRTVYYVAEEAPAKAEAIIAKFMAPNEKVEAYGSLPQAAVQALRLKPGEFTHAWISHCRHRCGMGISKLDGKPEVLLADDVPALHL
jgi:hypothetical protein